MNGELNPKFSTSQGDDGSTSQEIISWYAGIPSKTKIGESVSQIERKVNASNQESVLEWQFYQFLKS